MNTRLRIILLVLLGTIVLGACCPPGVAPADWQEQQFTLPAG